MNKSKKYCRSLHAQISLGTTSDDRFMPDGYVSVFADMEKLIFTEKLDGQNNCFNQHGVFARSHTEPTKHPWDKPLIERWQLIKNDLNNLEIFGENMFGIHSIAYNKLESYFYVFAVREHDVWLSWEEVKFYADLLDFPTVPEIELNTDLKSFLEPDKPENLSLSEWLTANLGMTWEESVDTPGLLGGHDPTTKMACSEGFVIRNNSSFKTNQGKIDVAPNEFNNLLTLVRKSHVKTDVHWTKTWKPAKLIDYEKYNWLSHSYLSSM